MTQARLLVDPLGPLKTWLRTQNITGVGQRVYIGDPTNATLPYVSLTLVEAPTDPGEVPLCRAHVQCCAQAATELEAATAIWDLVTKCEEIDAGTTLDPNGGGGLDCMGASLLLGPMPRDDEMGPRYLAGVEFTVIAR